MGSEIDKPGFHEKGTPMARKKTANKYQRLSPIGASVRTFIGYVVLMLSLAAYILSPSSQAVAQPPGGNPSGVYVGGYSGGNNRGGSSGVFVGGYSSGYPRGDSSGYYIGGQTGVSPSNPTFAFPGGMMPRQPHYAPSDNTVIIQMHVPADAEIWFNGEKTSQAGTVREFKSPPVMPGKPYLYRIWVRWKEQGKYVARTREAPVFAGDRLRFDFPN
jgi:uncharacterized protein (TIGR03000 family)